jgi:RNAse (barnase) inhibitor barstar
MKIQNLLKAGENCLFTVAGPLQTLMTEIQPISESPNVAVRYLRGFKCADKASFFNEASAALQFPPYFGENWDAFHDCLNDLDNIRSTTLLIVIIDAGSFLVSPKEAIGQFQAMITETALNWHKPPVKGKAPRTLRVLYHAETESLMRHITGATKLM